MRSWMRRRRSASSGYDDVMTFLYRIGTPSMRYAVPSASIPARVQGIWSRQSGVVAVLWGSIKTVGIFARCAAAAWGKWAPGVACDDQSRIAFTALEDIHCCGLDPGYKT